MVIFNSYVTNYQRVPCFAAISRQSSILQNPLLEFFEGQGHQLPCHAWLWLTIAQFIAENSFDRLQVSTIVIPSGKHTKNY